MQKQYLTYLYLLSALHTGGSAQAGNMVGIAREVQTDLPYLTASSLRGKLRSLLEKDNSAIANVLFGRRLDPQAGEQPTEGGVWISDATLLFFPIASYSHQFLWISCPLWLSRWNRWLNDPGLATEIVRWKELFAQTNGTAKTAVATIPEGEAKIYLRGAILQQAEVEEIAAEARLRQLIGSIPKGGGILELEQKLVILGDENCAALVEMGLQREVRIQLETSSKTAKDGSFRSEEAIPSETVMFFPWGTKLAQAEESDKLRSALGAEGVQRMQFGGLEGLGRGWAEVKTIDCVGSNTNVGAEPVEV